MKVGFVGLGLMGSGMAGALLRAGHEVTVWNRSPARAEPLAAQGAAVAPDLAALAAGEEIVFTSLPDDAALEEVVLGPHGLVANLTRGAIHVGTSTIGTAMARRLEKAHAQAGQVYVSAPVFGRPDVAAKGELAVVAAGPGAALERLAPAFTAIGRMTQVMGEDPQQANLAKLAGNFLIASVIESLGEALALVAKGGVDQQAYLDLLTSTLFSAPVYRTYGQLIVDRAYEPAGFALPLGAKDVRLALAAGEELKVPLPIGSLLRDRLMTMIATEGEAKDWSSLGELAKIQSGQ
ncbi:NAD(P)-dependent oxidoreductase [Ancylobacter mangrovi]|uniref:NAD(P)-dependent oxidoreductase n=1 Tax=Ancylobacter mangrovi TaxID=2972472 RepID=UPI0021625C1C|nr:NAD(P)-dependent oxidoreductase [Ancylobacter mangrovi]MCS0504179.1 NAD(P)-dependent oxidoreductase [Ancylobacter mangrovi]